MATYRASIAASRPVHRHISRPSSRRSLVFFVHHRSGSQQCYIPPTSPNRSWAQPVAQIVNYPRKSNWDHIFRSHPWAESKTIHHQWTQNHKTVINDWFHATSGKPHQNLYKVRRSDWAYNTRNAAQKANSIHKSLFRALDIMSKPYTHRVVRSNRPVAVKMPAQTDASVKPCTGTATSNAPLRAAFEQQPELDPSTLPKSEAAVVHDEINTSTSFGATNPEIAPSTLEAASTPGTSSQHGPGSARAINIDETTSQKVVPDIHATDSQNDAEVLGWSPKTFMDKDLEFPSEKKPEPALQTSAENMEYIVPIKDSGKKSELSPADLIASLRYYDRRRGALPDEEPLSPEDVAALESSRTKLTKGKSHSETSSDHSAGKSSFKKIGLAVSSIVLSAYVFGVGAKLLSIQPESTAATELLSAVQRSKVAKGRMD
ncbi:hypothetical protein TWF481_002518 [Arthrobotrys musiformis]|uniref:Uncharacterized protein n=1 Tax=Arthrobotrys musiformis TaxID=47236 RepID=A0AAV9VUN3_9PEZI